MYVYIYKSVIIDIGHYLIIQHIYMARETVVQSQVESYQKLKKKKNLMSFCLKNE